MTHEMKKEIHMLNFKDFINPQINKYNYCGLAVRGSRAILMESVCLAWVAAFGGL